MRGMAEWRDGDDVLLADLLAELGRPFLTQLVCGVSSTRVWKPGRNRCSTHRDAGDHRQHHYEPHVPTFVDVLLKALPECDRRIDHHNLVTNDSQCMIITDMLTLLRDISEIIRVSPE